MQRGFRVVFLSAVLCSFATLMAAPAPPANAPGEPTNIFYGEVPPNGDIAPILVFIPGLNGRAQDWFEGSATNPNDAYIRAFEAGYRTAFISLNADSSRNNANIQDNADVLKVLLPQVATHYNASNLYAVTHSKGGLDLQVAMMDPNVAKLLRAVFLIACPCSGSPLADWADGPGRPIAELLGLINPGVLSLKTAEVAALRQQLDPLFSLIGVPFYYLAGTSSDGNVLTQILGGILDQLAPGDPNDGFVTLSSTKLPASYAVSMGTIPVNHFDNKLGKWVMPKILPHLQGLQLTTTEFEKKTSDGFGDPFNTWAWSMEWFEGKLYVGSGRMIQCVSMLTSDVQAGTNFYPDIGVKTGDCPPGEVLYKELGAEIWQFTPETNQWAEVYKSPDTIPLGVDSQGQPVAFTARDIGFRGMLVYKEADNTERLYVGGATSGSIYDKIPPYDTMDFPPPRILYTDDGTTWNEVPQAPGTFLGEIGQPVPGSSRLNRTIRGMTQYKGRMFATVGDFRGVGYLIESADPSAGNDAWRRVSPAAETMPIWQVEVFNNWLYVGTGDKALPNNPGYGVFKTDAEGTPPYNFIPIITDGGHAPELFRAPNVLSFGIFNDQLYVGTNAPTELVRINADDTWDLMVGFPRDTPQGFKSPLTGFTNGLANNFTGHMWRMAKLLDKFFLSTWNWSSGMRYIAPLDTTFRAQYGFDLYRTMDGIHWTPVTKTGFNDFNYGGRSITPTPFGSFVGSATPSGGFQVYRDKTYNDLDQDGDTDQDDVSLLEQALNQPASGPDDPRDLDRDGVITNVDSLKLSAVCTEPGCAVSPPDPTPPSVENLNAASKALVGNNVVLTWDPVPGAVKYHVYRGAVQNLLDFLPPDFTLNVPGFPAPIKVPEDILAGKLDFTCGIAPNGFNCLLVKLIKGIDDAVYGYPLPNAEVATTNSTSYQEPAPSAYQSIYFVLAEDASGHLSEMSNIAPGPSFAAPPSVTSLLKQANRLAVEGSLPRATAASVTDTLSKVAKAGSMAEMDRLLQRALNDIETGMPSGDRSRRARLEGFTSMIHTLNQLANLADRGIVDAQKLRAAIR